MKKQPAIYIMSNKINGTLYVGVTSNLIQRVYTHKQGKQESFTQKYALNTLVYYEIHATMEIAITREKQIKGGSRQDKLKLINAFNPKWEDLYAKII